MTCRPCRLTLALASVMFSPLVAQNGEAAPPVAEPAFDAASEIERGCAILLEMQEGEGRREWPYEGVYRTAENGRRRVIPIGYRVGGTSIAARALIDSPGYADDEPRRAAVGRAVDFVLESLELPLMQPSTADRYDVRGWGHIYALSFLLRLRELDAVPAGREERVDAKVTWLVDTLVATAIPKVGGWAYGGRSSASPFMTAPALQALFHAARRGEDVDAGVVDEALVALERGRAASGSIAYSTPGRSRAETEEDALRFMDKLPGAIGRMVAVESTLWLAGRGDQGRLAAAVDAFFEHWEQLEVRRQKNGTHVRPYGVAPYYFIYAHHYAAQAIELLQDDDLRARQRARLLETFAKVREPDGGWNDRVFPRSLNYGTAMIVLALRLPELPALATWSRAAESGEPGEAAAATDKRGTVR